MHVCYTCWWCVCFQEWKRSRKPWKSAKHHPQENPPIQRAASQPSSWRPGSCFLVGKWGLWGPVSGQVLPSAALSWSLRQKMYSQENPTHSPTAAVDQGASDQALCCLGSRASPKSRNKVKEVPNSARWGSKDSNKSCF
jgi:hypothetical protein